MNFEKGRSGTGWLNVPAVVGQYGCVVVRPAPGTILEVIWTNFFQTSGATQVFNFWAVPPFFFDESGGWRAAGGSMGLSFPFPDLSERSPWRSSVSFGMLGARITAGAHPFDVETMTQVLLPGAGSLPADGGGARRINVDQVGNNIVSPGFVQQQDGMGMLRLRGDLERGLPALVIQPRNVNVGYEAYVNVREYKAALAAESL